jgi:hypothetical protein
MPKFKIMDDSNNKNAVQHFHDYFPTFNKHIPQNSTGFQV